MQKNELKKGTRKKIDEVKIFAGILIIAVIALIVIAVISGNTTKAETVTENGEVTITIKGLTEKQRVDFGMVIENGEVTEFRS